MKISVEFIEPKRRLPDPRWFILAVAALLLLIACVAAHAGPVQLTASWYSRASLAKEGTWKHGKEERMANGERFHDNNLTCATRLYVLGHHLRVTNIKNNKSVIVKVTDRIGKRFASTRIDLSKLAFSRIAELKDGLVAVTVEEVK
jgi:rare lipoprotein A